MESILVVDDNKSIINVLQVCISREGYNCITAFDCKEALLKFRQFSPSLILLDLMLSEIDGFEVCKTVRGESNVPIIIMSAIDDEEDIIKGFNAGADYYVTKPCSIKLIIARIKAVLRRTSISGNISMQ